MDPIALVNILKEKIDRYNEVAAEFLDSVRDFVSYPEIKASENWTASCSQLSEIVSWINQIADAFLISKRRDLLSQAAKFERFEVMLCHSGVQKEGFTSLVHVDLEERDVKSFLDEESLKLGDMPDDRMTYVTATCPVGVAIISESFLQSFSPMLELAIFGARLRRWRSLCVEPPTSSEDKLDWDFRFIPSFYNTRRKSDWTNVVVNLPLPCEMATGVRYDSKERQQSKQIVKEVIKHLESKNLRNPNVSPNRPLNCPLCSDSWDTKLKLDYHISTTHAPSSTADSQ
jgi:hypothetical protein